MTSFSARLPAPSKGLWSYFELHSELGGRLPLKERSELSEPQQQLFDRMTTSVTPWAERPGFASRDQDGRFVGPFNAFLLSPVIAGSFFLTFRLRKSRTLR